MVLAKTTSGDSSVSPF